MKAVALKRGAKDWRGTLIGVGLALVTLAAYWQVRRFGFVNYDDLSMLVDSPMVGSGLTLRGIGWALKTSYFEYWHPVTWLSHMLDYELFGARPGWHHLVSVGVHAANTVLLFAVLRRMTAALWPSAVVAGLFALHPLHVESVAWLAERKDMLSGLFFMLTLWAYSRYAEARKPKPGIQQQQGQRTSQRPGPSLTHHLSRITFQSSAYYTLALLFYALGLMSKPMLVTVPFVLLLLDYWPLGRLDLSTPAAARKNCLRLLWEKLAFLALSCGSAAITYSWALKTGRTFLTEAEPWGLRLSHLPVAYVRYLWKTIWPADLAVVYPVPSYWPWWQVWGAVLVLGLITIILTVRARSAPYGLVGWLIFLGMLFPTLRLLQAAHQSIADRYTYLPSIGLFVVLVFGVGAPGSATRRGVAGKGVLAGLALAGCLVMTHLQVQNWRDGETLFRHALAVTEANPVAYNNLGTALERQGKLDEAMHCYAEAVRLKPGTPEAQCNLGLALMKKGRLNEAEAQFRQALERHPKSASAWYDLGNALFRQGKNEAAAAAFRQALDLRKDYPAAHNDLACALALLGKPDEALVHFQQALLQRPDDAETLSNLGAVLTDAGRPADALAPLTRAIQLKPDYADAHYNLGNAYAALKRPQSASSEYQTAVKLDPRHGLAQYRLANLFRAGGNPAAAAEHYRAALAVNPKHAEAHYQLATLLVPRKEVEEGIKHYHEALRLKPDWVMPLNNLAWLLATHAEARYRDGAQAVRLATQTVELTKRHDPEVLDTLGAALAEAGRFTEAIKVAQEALSGAAAAGQTNLASQIADRIKLYQGGSPYLEMPQ